ncbi:hypothetical protein A0H81_13916 [Grifola frondosa]|uniref:Uncharacterized protein n=2 Tax=Grifola frondosa TaxID=5627 RepID=A0A1C7LMS6_GRIFR|nr:hypothetical protein A0H81_13916 [Grifola frondosa]
MDNIAATLRREPTMFPANDRFFFNFVESKVFEIIRKRNGPYAEWFIAETEQRQAEANQLEGGVLDRVKDVMRRSTMMAAMCARISNEEPQIFAEDVPTIEVYVGFATAIAMTQSVLLFLGPDAAGSPEYIAPQTPPPPRTLLSGYGSFGSPSSPSGYSEAGGSEAESHPSTPYAQTPVRRSMTGH